MIYCLFFVEFCRGKEVLSMATKLKNLKITSTDLVDQGANPESFVRLIKSQQGGEKMGEEEDKLNQEENNSKKNKDKNSEKNKDKNKENEKSPDKLTEKRKREMLTHISEIVAECFEQLSAKMLSDSWEFSSEEMQEGLGELQETSGEKMKKAREQSALQEELADLRKKYQLKELEEEASRFEIIGKNKKSLAQELFVMKSAGAQVYDTFVKSLEEQVDLVEKKGLFREFGKNTSGGCLFGVDELQGKANEIAKRDGVSMSVAMEKAFEENPDLALEYEKNYVKKGV